MPLTSHGKLNRRALPAPERKLVGVERTYIAPRDTMELNLTQIWEELLDTRPIGMSDNFFELGGHSMLAARMMARIERLAGIKAPLNLIFQEPTIERLSLVLRRMPGAVPVSTSLVEIQSGTSPAPFFCIHPSGGQVLSYVPLSRYLGMDQTFYGLQARGLDRTQEPATSIEEMAAYYIEVMRGEQPEGPFVLGGWSMGGVVAYEMGRQLHAQGHEVSLLALLDAHLPGSGKQLEEMDDLRLLETFALDMGISFQKFDTCSIFSNSIFRRCKSMCRSPVLFRSRCSRPARTLLIIRNYRTPSGAPYLPHRSIRCPETISPWCRNLTLKFSHSN
jgi:hypothetical protein